MITLENAANLDERYKGVTEGFILAHWDGDDFEFFCSATQQFSTSVWKKYFPFLKIGAALIIVALVLFAASTRTRRSQKKPAIPDKS
jgi:hypothetical protein